MSHVININADRFEEEVIKSDLPVLVDFWAPWCTPCLMMAPILDEVANEMQGKLKVVKINIDDGQNSALAHIFQIKSIPSMKIFKAGAVAREFVGLTSKEVIVAALE